MVETEGYLRTETDESSQLLTVILDRRDNEKNQLNSDLIHALETVLAPELTRPRYRGIILVSARPKVFSTGADIEGDLLQVDQLEAARFCREGRRVFDLLTQIGCPTVAAISGFALGGGLELALCCDFRVAYQNSRIGLPEINLGLIPGWGGTQRLARLIGRSRALRMILSGDPVNATTALDYGLVDEVVEDHAALVPAAQQLLQRFAGKSRSAVSLAKRALNLGGGMTLADGLELETELFALAWSTPDREEGINAFMAKRRPGWTE